MLRHDLYKPMTPSGGAFLACVGACLAVGSFQPNPVRLQMLMIGFIAGACALIATAFYVRVIRRDKPTLYEAVMVWPPAIASVAVMWLLSGYLPNDARLLWLVALAVTGVHFLPMYWSFGPAIVMLGSLCTIGAVVGWFIPDLPLGAVIAADGSLKLVFGLLMFAGAFRDRRPPEIDETVGLGDLGVGEPLVAPSREQELV